MIVVGAAVTGTSATLVASATASLIGDTGSFANSVNNNKNSVKFRKNMINEGIAEPDYPNAAYHIVPATAQAQEAETARSILENCGIDINDAANGVFLPTESGHGLATIHSGRHTNAYIKEVLRRLQFANSANRSEVEAVLYSIMRDLLNGTLRL